MDAALARMAPQQFISQLVERLGAPGVCGIAIFAMCGAFALGTLRSEIAELGRLQAQRAVLMARHSAQAAANDLSPEQRLARFYAGLPRRAEIETVAESIFAIAKSFGITLRQGNYRYAVEPGTRLGRYEISYIAQTEYYRVRLMLRELQRLIPALALQDIAFQRQQVAVPAPEVTLKFSLYVRKD